MFTGIYSFLRRGNPAVQSGVIPYKIVDDNTLVLLVTSRKKKKWILPKGIVEAPMTLQESATKEAWEEAGALGIVGRTSTGTLRFKKQGIEATCTYYPLRVTKLTRHYPEMKFRKRKWVKLTEAHKYVKSKDLQKLLKSFKPSR